MYKAVFLDMDGTLLRKDHSISVETREVIRRLISSGVPVILISARPVDGMLPMFHHIGLPEHYPLISLNGSYIVEGDEPVFDSRIDLGTAAAVSEIVRPYQATIAYYVQREWYAECSDKWTEKEQRIMDVPLRVVPVGEMMTEWESLGVAPNKMMVMSEPAAIDEIQSHLRSIYGNRLNIYPSKPTYLEVMEPGGSKANAVKWMIGRLGILAAETITMGDNYNDREMIEFAGMGVAMGNAPDEIKAAADYVTDTNNEDGVRKALEFLFKDSGLL